MKNIVPIEHIQKWIYLIRGQKVMLDQDLANIYGVSVGRLNEAVKRNQERFPSDFMYQLTETEWKNLKSQIAISSLSWGGRRHAPYVFTEQGVAMLSSVLRSRRAVQMNIMIMRAFVKLREMISAHKELSQRMNLLEHRLTGNDEDIRQIYKIIQDWAPPEGKKQIGFR